MGEGSLGLENGCWLTGPHLPRGGGCGPLPFKRRPARGGRGLKPMAKGSSRGGCSCRLSHVVDTTPQGEEERKQTSTGPGTPINNDRRRPGRDVSRFRAQSPLGHTCKHQPHMRAHTHTPQCAHTNKNTHIAKQATPPPPRRVKTGRSVIHRVGSPHSPEVWVGIVNIYKYQLVERCSCGIPAKKKKISCLRHCCLIHLFHPHTWRHMQPYTPIHAAPLLPEKP